MPTKSKKLSVCARMIHSIERVRMPLYGYGLGFGLGFGFGFGFGFG